MDAATAGFAGPEEGGVALGAGRGFGEGVAFVQRRALISPAVYLFSFFLAHPHFTRV